jgi:hypothetical protein
MNEVEMNDLSTAKVRKNYWLCDAQLKMCAEDSPRLDSAAEKLQMWQNSYLAELVKRGEQI